MVHMRQQYTAESEMLGLGLHKLKRRQKEPLSLVLSCCLAVLVAYVLTIGPKQTGTGRSQLCNNARNLLTIM